MKPVVLSDVLAVGEFPTPEQVAILAKAGFKSILNNQPDGEVARFELDAGVAAEAKRHGLAHAYAPLSSRTPPADELQRYADALAVLPAPIYAFCYSGSRSAAACALLLTATTDVVEIVRQFGEAGFDLAGLTPWLEEERARRVPPGKAGEAKPQSPAPADTNGNVGEHGRAAVPASPAAAAIARPEDATGLPRMIVVQPRAAGYGGFAM